MATTFPANPPASAAVAVTRSAVTDAVPWYIWSLFAASVSVVIGGYWDISWHMSIGRDSFWTPAHMAIQACGIIAAITSSYLIFSCTLGRDPALRSATVEVWKFHGPLGAFIAAWGGATMLASAPFDNWWHNAYGLDVKIFSPPHVVLDGGVLAIQFGAVVLIASAMNRAERRAAPKARLDSASARRDGHHAGADCGLGIHLSRAACIRRNAIAPSRSSLRSSLMGFAEISGRRWARTTVAGIYTAYAIFMLWLFPLFPATPKLGPVYQKITHMVPMEFPLLIIVPALALDALWPKIGAVEKVAASHRGWTGVPVDVHRSAVALCGFPGLPGFRQLGLRHKIFRLFRGPGRLRRAPLVCPAAAHAAGFWRIMGEAGVASILSTRLGLAWGDWVRKIRR